MAGRTFMSARVDAQAGHAARMDRIYRSQRHFYDLTRKYYLLGRDRAIRALQPPVHGTVLEVGCGTARNLVAIARRYPRATVYGVDISREMLASARVQVARAQLGARVFVAQADAATLDPVAVLGQATFDRILFSYTLSMIPDWRGAVAHAVGMLAPAGTLTVVDFGDLCGLPKWFGLGLRAWLAKFDVTPRDELPGWIGALAAERGLEIGHERLHGGYAMQIVVRWPL